MARRDYKHRPRRSPKKSAPRRSPWLYFAVGMLTGAAATVLVYFNEFVPVPEMEVAVPDEELKPGSAETRNTPAAPATYYLQAGSFRRPEEADKMKANLAFLGLESSIQTVAINGADTWHRVRIGPFSDLADLNDARRRLMDNEIESIVLKVRG